MREIERIELVAGPASALYGGNAVTGVINIITAEPPRLRSGGAGGAVSSTHGTSGTQDVSASIVGTQGIHRWRVGLEGRRLDRATESLQATRALRIHGTATGRIGPQATYRMDGGYSHQEGGVSLGLLVVGIERGARGFIQASVEHGVWTSHTRLYDGSKELVNAPSAFGGRR